MSAADNLLQNSSFEWDNNADSWPDGWSKEIQSGKTATFAWSSDSKYGKKSVSISDPTGWANIKSNRMPHEPGAAYILSGYVKTAGTTGITIVKAKYYDAAGAEIGQQSKVFSLMGTHNWTRLQVVIDQIPTGTAELRVIMQMDTSTGTSYFDGIQLEKGTVRSAYNLVDNPSFERDADGNKIPDKLEVL